MTTLLTVITFTLLRLGVPALGLLVLGSLIERRHPEWLAAR